MKFTCAYCVMDELEICKVLFYVFDPDKQGYIFVDDLKALMNIVHNVKHPDTVTGIVKEEWKKLAFNADGRIEFNEFLKYHNLSPWLMKPVFRLQTTMQQHSISEAYWDDKKRELHDKRMLADLIMKKKAEKKLNKKKNVKERKLKKKMGLIKYYLCPCYRKFYDTDNVVDYLTEDEKKERAEKIKLARRMADLKAKNPETAPWKKFEKKINPDITPGGDAAFVEEKIEKIERKRGERVENRAERRRKRQNDEHLVHKFSTTVTKADI